MPPASHPAFATLRRSRLGFVVAWLAASTAPAPAPAAGTPVELPAAIGVAQAKKAYEEFLLGPRGTGLRIVESLCQRRRGGRVCPVSSEGERLGVEQAASLSRTWYFVPPLPPAASPQGPALGSLGDDPEMLTGWLVPLGFVAEGNETLAAWRQALDENLVVDCSVIGCEVFAPIETAAKPADEQWIAKCWVEVVSGVRGPVYGCRQVAAIRGEEVWLRALRSTDRIPVERPPRPPFRPVVACRAEISDPSALLLEALATGPLPLVARPLPRGRGVVAVAAPRPSTVLAGLVEHPSVRVEVVTARQAVPRLEDGRVVGVEPEPAWAYDLELTARLEVGEATAAEPALRPASDEETARWVAALRERLGARLAAACAAPVAAGAG